MLRRLRLRVRLFGDGRTPVRDTEGVPPAEELGVRTALARANELVRRVRRVQAWVGAGTRRVRAHP